MFVELQNVEYGRDRWVADGWRQAGTVRLDEWRDALVRFERIRSLFYREFDVDEDRIRLSYPENTRKALDQYLSDLWGLRAEQDSPSNKSIPRRGPGYVEILDQCCDTKVIATFRRELERGQTVIVVYRRGNAPPIGGEYNIPLSRLLGIDAEEGAEEYRAAAGIGYALHALGRNNATENV